MNEILIDNKDGQVWNISDLVSGITWKTSRSGKASSLDVTFVKNGLYESKNFKYNNGDIIRYRKDDVNVFYGYIFTIDDGRSEDVKIVAYDQMRYLLYNDTLIVKDMTATQVIQRVANDLGLKTGVLENTGHKIPRLAEDNKKLLDIIYKALDHTLVATQNMYVLYDHFGELTLRNAANMLVDFVIGDESLMVDYRQKRSIDSETYNRIKLVQDNKEAGTRDAYVLQDGANVAKWGRLQLYEKVDNNMNSAQINDRLDKLLQLKNREQKSLHIPALGDFRVRAGCYVPIKIKAAGIDQYFLVDECVHNIEGAEHTMELDLKVI